MELAFYLQIALIAKMGLLQGKKLAPTLFIGLFLPHCGSIFGQRERHRTN